MNYARLQRAAYRWFIIIAGRLGIEPRLTASKAAVLPLDDLPILFNFLDEY